MLIVGYNLGVRPALDMELSTGDIVFRILTNLAT